MWVGIVRDVWGGMWDQQQDSGSPDDDPARGAVWLELAWEGKAWLTAGGERPK
jgi:hypothetical protein